MTYDPYFTEATWFPPERKYDQGDLGTIVLVRWTFCLRKSNKHPGLMTTNCKKFKDFVRKRWSKAGSEAPEG